jgi:glycosyltransferase involved in cell wall biosynthesis
MNPLESSNRKAWAGATSGPLVSVITPVLNGKRYLATCIESVLSQSYPNIEHVVVDGGSTDGTLEMLAEYSSKYPARVRYMTGKDKNPEDAWNKGICASKGDILGWLGSDDVYLPGAVEAVVDFFRMNPDAAFVFGGFDTIDEQGNVLERNMSKDFDFDEALNDTCWIPTTSAFYTREVVQNIGLLDTELVPADFDYWIRIAKVYRPYRIHKALSQFRIHPGSITGSPGIGAKYAYATYRTSRRHGGRVFSRRLYRYLILLAANFCRPVLEPVYPWIKRLLNWLWQ